MLCPHCGTEYQNGTCPKGCQVPALREEQPKKRRDWWIWLVAAFAGFLLGFLVGAGNVDERVPYEGTTSTETAYKYSCEVLAPESFAEGAEQYKGNPYTFTGTVMEVLNPKDNWNHTLGVRLLAKMGKSEAVIFLTLDPADQETIRKGDSLSVWGTCRGFYTYQTDEGETVTLPKLDVVYYTLSNAKK